MNSKELRRKLASNTEFLQYTNVYFFRRGLKLDSDCKLQLSIGSPLLTSEILWLLGMKQFGFP